MFTDDIVTRKRILWALRGFKPFKSAGPDQIIPAELQNNSVIILPHLEAIFKGCLKLGYIPRYWTEVNVVFIPKAGKSSHVYPKDLRPITLSSFLLKTLERLLDVYIRDKIGARKWSSSQHAYTKGRSVDTALHALVSTIEKSINSKEFCLVAFLDIKGAFNNVKAEAIKEGLSFLEVDVPLIGLINYMLGSRIVSSKLGDSTFKRRVTRGTPQGGFCPLFSGT